MVFLPALKNVSHWRLRIVILIAILAVVATLLPSNAATNTVPVVIGTSGPLTARTWASIPLTGVPYDATVSIELKTSSSHPFALSSRQDQWGHAPKIVKTNQSGSVTVLPVADSSITNEHPNNNYGTSPWLFLESTRDIRSYLKFNLPVSLPTGTSQTTLPDYNRTYVLKVFVLVSDPVGFTVRLTKTNWTESGTGSITYNNRPAYYDATTPTTGPTTTPTSTPTTGPTTTPTTTPTTPPTTVPPTGAALDTKVQGGVILDGLNRPIQLRGINRSGLENGCVQEGKFLKDSGNGAGSTPGYAVTAAQAFLTWDDTSKAGHAINTVRVPLNESCWLGINGANSNVSGDKYQQFVRDFVKQLTAQNMRVVLDLHWSAPGTRLATTQDVAPNKDHSITFWSQVADQFKGYGNVLFDLYNEPYVDCGHMASCSSSGYFPQDDEAWNAYINGNVTVRNDAGVSFINAGIKPIITAIRATGSKNPVIVETLGYGSGYLDMMGAHLAGIDPLNQVIASSHAYNFSGYNATSTGSFDLKNILQTGKNINGIEVRNITGIYPYYMGEYSDSATACTQGTTAPFIQATRAWLNDNQASGTAWGWEQGMHCDGPGLVSNSDTGTPYPSGVVVRQLLQADQGKTIGTN